MAHRPSKRNARIPDLRESRRTRGLLCRRRRHALLGARAAEREQIEVLIRRRVVLAIAAHQRLVVIAEVQAQPAIDPVEIALASAPLDEQRTQGLWIHLETPLAAEGERIEAGRVGMADRDAQVVGEVVVGRDRVEEPRPHVDRVDEAADDLALVAAGLDADDALERPAAQIERAFARIAVDMDAAELVPIGVRRVEAGEAARGIAPERVCCAGSEEAVVKSTERTIELQAELTAQGNRDGALRTVDRAVGDRSAKAIRLEVEA